jgi:hypothetical protein
VKIKGSIPYFKEDEALQLFFSFFFLEQEENCHQADGKGKDKMHGTLKPSCKVILPVQYSLGNKTIDLRLRLILHVRHD